MLVRMTSLAIPIRISIVASVSVWSSATKQTYIVWVDVIDGVIKLFGARG